MPRPNPNVTDNMPKYVPADLPKDVLNSFATKSPRYQVALDDTSPPSERLAVDRLRANNLSAAVVVSSRSCTKPIGKDSYGFLGNGNSTFITSIVTIFDIGPIPLHSSTETGKSPLPAQCAPTLHKGS